MEEIETGKCTKNILCDSGRELEVLNASVYSQQCSAMEGRTNPNKPWMACLGCLRKQVHIYQMHFRSSYSRTSEHKIFFVSFSGFKKFYTSFYIQIILNQKSPGASWAKIALHFSIAVNRRITIYAEAPGHFFCPENQRATTTTHILYCNRK